MKDQGIERVTTLVGAEAAIDRQPAQREVADGIEQLVADEFVLVAKTAGIEDPVLVDGHRVVERRAKGIAGLASMAVVSHMLTDFKDMDVATHQDIHHKLKDHRYVLRNSALVPDDDNPASSQEKERYRENHLSQNPHPLMLRAVGYGPFIGGIVLFSALIPIFLFTNANVLFRARFRDGTSLVERTVNANRTTAGEVEADKENAGERGARGKKGKVVGGAVGAGGRMVAA